MIPFNYHHLYYFYVIAKAGSISKACETLYLAQSTLSAQIKLFEKSLRKQLFERQKQRLILTEEGRVVLDYAESIFEIGQEMQDTLNANIQPIKSWQKRYLHAWRVPQRILRTTCCMSI